MLRQHEGVIYMDNMDVTNVILAPKNATYAIPVISLVLQREGNRRPVLAVTWGLTIQTQNPMENQSMVSFMKKKKNTLISTGHYLRLGQVRIIVLQHVNTATCMKSMVGLSITP